MENKTPYMIAIFSADSKEELIEKIKAFGSYALINADILERCHVASEHINKKQAFRGFVVFRNWEEYINQISEQNIRYINISELKENYRNKTVMLFPGNGIYQKHMLDILYNINSFFKERITVLQTKAINISEVDIMDDSQDSSLFRQLNVFVSELVIAQFWEHCGISADYLIGHSMGEYAAACFAGVFDAEQAMKMLTIRNSVVEKASSLYRMLAVETNLSEFESEVSNLGIEIAAYNAPNLFTLSGKADAIKILYDSLKKSGIQCYDINTSYGGHLSILKSEADEFCTRIKELTFSPYSKKIISTVYPDNVKESFICPRYWANHIYMPVRFSEAVRKIPVSEIKNVIDVGVNPAMLSMAMKNIMESSMTWIPTIRAGRNYRQQFCHALGLAYLSGTDVKLNLD